MAFANPTAYSKGRINRAGEAARQGNASGQDMEVINNWRASHAYILNTFQATLRNRTRGTDIAVAQRLKRLRTLVNKLERLPRMQLSRMDDVAGCRLIFRSIRELTEFRNAVHKARFDHKLRNEVEKYDYIASPKPDGYRGIHDIYEYNVRSETGMAYNGLLLELQYRTIYQHAWATTVEIVGMITENQPKFHAGDQRHIEFFRLASEIIARTYERKSSCYPHIGNRELVRKFRELDREIRILQLLRGLNTSTEQMGGRKNVILSMSGAGQLSLFTYAKGTDALRKYFELEKLHGGADVVLVKADTGADIRLSYKNYFSDPADFLTYVNHGCNRLSRPTTRLARRR
ncbi:MAG: RelA/SpoT domain-containing protein [Rhizobiales bacterium]|nr:RelA/SpoT domain-containing protein [Hyphomicrobiales bacterium]